MWSSRHILASVPSTAAMATFRDAADRLAKGDSGVRFPEGTFPPGLPYVPTVADLLSGG